jgi:hypothetical protein
MKIIGLIIDSCIICRNRHHTHQSVTIELLHDNWPIVSKDKFPEPFSAQ